MNEKGNFVTFNFCVCNFPQFYHTIFVCILQLSKDSLTSHEKSTGSSQNAFTKRRMSILSSEHDKPTAAQLGRRRSTFKGTAAGITGLTTMLSMRRMTKGRLSNANAEDLKPKVRLENTYKLNPDDGKLFRCGIVHKIAKETLQSYLEHETYNESLANKLACDVSQNINQKVKLLNFPRYRIVVNTIIGQCNEQAVEMASRCIWNDSTDTFTSVSYKNETMFSVVTIHGVYFD